MDEQTEGNNLPKVEVKPNNIPFKCVVCNGFGTLKFGAKTCQACDGSGYLVVSQEDGQTYGKSRMD